MTRIFSGNIRKTLILLVSLAILPALMIIFHAGIEHRDHIIEEAQRDVLFLAESMALVQKGYFNATHQMLAALARTREVRSLDGEAASALFRSMLEKNAAYINIVAVDKSGNVFASALPFVKPTSLADRPHFQQAMADKQFTVGEYIVTRVGQFRPSLPFAYPVLDDNGNVSAVLSTAMHLEHLAQSFDVTRLPKDSFIAVTDGKGIRVFLHPARSETNPIGRPITKAAWDRARNAQVPGISVNEGSDGIRRIFAFHPIQLPGRTEPCMFMWAGIPESAVTRPANQTLIRNLLLMAGAGLLAIAIAWLVGRKILIQPVHQLIKTMTDFAEGHSDARCGIRDHSGEIGSLAAAFDDMADRLAQSRKTLHSIADYTYDWEYWLGPDGDLLWMSPSCEKVTGYDPETFHSDPKLIDGLVHEEDRKTVLAHSDTTNLEQKQSAMDFRIRHASGRLVWINHHCRPIYDSEGKFLGRRISNRDITDRKQIENRLQQAQKMEAIGSLAGGIAHDFNNILFPIIGLSELLMEDLPEDSLERNNVMEIHRAAGRAKDLVRQILSFSRQTEHQKIPLPIQQVLKEVVKLARSTIPSNINLTIDIQPDCGPVLADPTNIHQIAMNLITNAFHAVEETSGRITIILASTVVSPDDCLQLDLKPGPHARLTVSDTGTGIPEDILPRIFNPYFTTKPQGKGTGMGLAVVFGIVKDHGGDIRVDSRVGQGTVFDVYLPILERETAPMNVQDSILPIGGNERVLLVDDEAAIVQMEKQMLERLGYRVTTQTDSRTALRMFRTDPSAFDLVVTDMAMPGMTGADLAREMIALRSDIPVILCTGFSEQITRDRAAHIGIRGFLMKPILRNRIASEIRRVLDLHQ